MRDVRKIIYARSNVCDRCLIHTLAVTPMSCAELAALDVRGLDLEVRRLTIRVQ